MMRTIGRALLLTAALLVFALLVSACGPATQPPVNTLPPTSIAPTTVPSSIPTTVAKLSSTAAPTSAATAAPTVSATVSAALSPTISATEVPTTSAACGGSFVSTYAIQGSGMSAAQTGTQTTEGVVVGDFQGSSQLNGFFIQDPAGDRDPATSDGLFTLGCSHCKQPTL